SLSSPRSTVSTCWTWPTGRHRRFRVRPFPRGIRTCPHRRARAGEMAGGGMNRTSTVWINGRLESAEKALLTVTDRGFQVGDGIFETLLVVGGRVLELPLHASRLQASDSRVAVRVKVSRGAVEGRALPPPDDVRPNVVVQAWRAEPPPPELISRGLRLSISKVRRDPTSPLATVKTTSRAEF